MAVGKTEIYIGTKEGNFLFHMDVLNLEVQPVDDTLVVGFLSAVNSFAKDMGWPAGASLIRSGNLECRISSGKYIFTSLLIENPYIIHTDSTLDTYISEMTNVICDRFEKKYESVLETAMGDRVYDAKILEPFKEEILTVINEFGEQIRELYFKLILVEAIYAKVPQKWCLPLISKVSAGEDVASEFPNIISKYPHFKNVISKINNDQRPIWEIFGVPLYESDAPPEPEQNIEKEE